MKPKFSPIVAMLLLAGVEAVAPRPAKSEDAKTAAFDAAQVTSAKLKPMRMRCFFGVTSATLAASDRDHGWLCMPEVRSGITH